jgi:hypothetical protein
MRCDSCADFSPYCYSHCSAYNSPYCYSHCSAYNSPYCYSHCSAYNSPYCNSHCSAYNSPYCWADEGADEGSNTSAVYPFGTYSCTIIRFHCPRGHRHTNELPHKKPNENSNKSSEAGLQRC